MRVASHVLLVLFCAGICWSVAEAAETSSNAGQEGVASWYGEQHRGRRMANGDVFDPDKMTAASWFYPLGTRVQVQSSEAGRTRTVVVTITDRGPHKRLVAEGRIIDLGRAAFAKLGDLDRGLLRVSVYPVSPVRSQVK